MEAICSLKHLSQVVMIIIYIVTFVCLDVQMIQAKVEDLELLQDAVITQTNLGKLTQQEAC